MIVITEIKTLKVDKDWAEIMEMNPYMDSVTAWNSAEDMVERLEASVVQEMIKGKRYVRQYDMEDIFVDGRIDDPQIMAAITHLRKTPNDSYRLREDWCVGWSRQAYDAIGFKLEDIERTEKELEGTTNDLFACNQARDSYANLIHYYERAKWWTRLKWVFTGVKV